MNHFGLKLIAVLVLAALAMPFAGSALTPQEVAKQRQDLLEDLMTKTRPFEIASVRWVCAMGQEPASVADDRSKGKDYVADASDTCVVALTRVAQFHDFPELYHKLLKQMGGDESLADTLPEAIKTAVLHGDGKAEIGNNKVAEIKPALAFDAGFTFAFQKGATNMKDINDAQLKKVSESCLGQGWDAKTCFSNGYVYGARAFNAQAAAPSR